jgi:hypothetical protein
MIEDDVKVEEDDVDELLAEELEVLVELEELEVFVELEERDEEVGLGQMLAVGTGIHPLPNEGPFHCPSLYLE